MRPPAIVRAGLVAAALLVAGCTTGNEPTAPLELRVGTILSLEGPASATGIGMEAAAKLAIAHANDAGFPIRVTGVHVGDRGRDPIAMPATLRGLADEGVTAVVGPCCSPLVAAILDNAIERQILIVAPAATGPGLTARENQGYFWRIPPSDVHQGRVLADLVAETGTPPAGLLVVNTEYGRGFAAAFEEAYTGRHGGTVVARDTIREEGQEGYASQVETICARDPASGVLRTEALVLAMQAAQAASVLQELDRAGCRSELAVYGSDSTNTGEGPDGLPALAGQDAQGRWLAAGVRGTLPATARAEEFATMFAGATGSPPRPWAAETYDGVAHIVLAAYAARATDAPAIKAQLLDNANAPGEPCRTIAACLALLDAGKDIDYQGYAHDIPYDAVGEPTGGLYQVWHVDDAGRIVVLERDRPSA